MGGSEIKNAGITNAGIRDRQYHILHQAILLRLTSILQKLLPSNGCRNILRTLAEIQQRLSCTSSFLKLYNL